MIHLKNSKNIKGFLIITFFLVFLFTTSTVYADQQFHKCPLSNGGHIPYTIPITQFYEELSDRCWADKINSNVFNIDGKNIVIYHEDVKKFLYWQNDYLDKGYIIDFDSHISKDIILKIPNTFEIFSWHSRNVSDINNLDPYWNIREGHIDWYQGVCYRTHVIHTDDKISILMINSGGVLAGQTIPVTLDIEPFCLDIFANPPPLMDCSLENQNHINLRGESVCVKSIEKLIDRDYLV